MGPVLGVLILGATIPFAGSLVSNTPYAYS